MFCSGAQGRGLGWTLININMVVVTTGHPGVSKGAGWHEHSRELRTSLEAEDRGREPTERDEGKQEKRCSEARQEGIVRKRK